MCTQVLNITGIAFTTIGSVVALISIITPHVLRHTFCTDLANAGLDIKSLQYVMGHSDANITMNVYTHARNDHAAEEML